jgi:prepilin-type N-terminal cleavage/methylation domain-containing protein
MQLGFRRLRALTGEVRPLHWTEAPMSTRRQRAGFSLVELMVVVAIIGFSAMAFMPAFGRAMADQELSRMIRKVVSLTRRARSEAMDSRTAMMLWIQPSVDASSPPTWQLMRSPLPSCTMASAVWPAIQATCPTEQDVFTDLGVAGGTGGGWAAGGQGCVENHTFGIDNSYSSGTYNMHMVERLNGADSIDPRALCWGADGVAYTGGALAVSLADMNGASTPTPGLRGAIIYRFGLREDGTQVGMGRTLSIPLSAAPTVLR